MKTSFLSRRSPNYRQRNDKRRESWTVQVARMNAGRERKRLERCAEEPPRVEWRGVHEHEITFRNVQTGEMHSLDLFRGRRRDQFRAEVDGRPWRTISATQLGELVRDKYKPHIRE